VTRAVMLVILSGLAVAAVGGIVLLRWNWLNPA
jgi:hypothetical protein